MSSVLPSNNSPLQHALAKLTEHELASLDFRVITHSHRADVCHSRWLPFLAWENSIADAEGWGFAETEAAQRALIANYTQIHQLKGTPAAIRQLFADLQLGDIDIIERVGDLRWDGTAQFDGKHLFGGYAGDWAQYGIVLKRVVSVAQAEVIKHILAEIAPIRCQLLYLDYRAHALYWDGEINFDGSYTFGAVL